MMDWQSEIFIATMVKQQVADADRLKVWEHPLPEPAAGEAETAAVEQALGFRLEGDYRDFLRCCNGWPSFYRAVDLFGTADLLAGPRHERARALLLGLKDLDELSGFALEDLLPIALSREGGDVFVMGTAHSLIPGVVFWVTGQVVESFDNFSAWFLVMVDYNRREQVRMLSLG